MTTIHPKTVIFHAPQGWGKTTNSESLRAEHGCDQTIDEWRPGQPITTGALHLTNTRPSDTEIAQLEEAGVQIVHAQGTNTGGAL